MRRVIKRDGSEVMFDITKIINAVSKANKNTSCIYQLTSEQIGAVANEVDSQMEQFARSLNVEEIQEIVENVLITKAPQVAKQYIRYRYERKLLRESPIDKRLESIVNYTNEEVKQENANKNPIIHSTQRDYIAGEISKDYTARKLLPPHIVKAHEDGIIHFHDSDYFIQRMHNCGLVNLDDMLQNGTVISDVKIDTPHLFSTACTIATQIISQVASSQYGGQSISLYHLSKFVDVTRKTLRSRYDKYKSGNFDDFIEALVKDDIRAGIQTIQYQVITIMTTNGQAPFITIYMDLMEAPDGQERDDLAICIEEMLRQRILGVKNKNGTYIAPAFPKLIYTLSPCNMNKYGKYRYLTELAAECTAKRMVPDYISYKKMKQLKGEVYTCMGCRSFLTPWNKKLGNIANAKNFDQNNGKYYGRFNQGVVTINLVDVALTAKQTGEDFCKLLDDRLELCHEALLLRHKRLLNTPSDMAPILWQHGAYARLEPGETINRLLFNGYSTISLGYAGLAECVEVITDQKLTSPAGKKIGITIMKIMNRKTDAWSNMDNISYSIYGTPIESTTYKFAKCLQKRFGKIKGITDKNYITNSYHIPVTEEIDAFSKLKFESEFQKLSPGGAISYVEVPDMKNNISAVLELIKCIYNNTMYAELNSKIDYCTVCGWNHEIKIVHDGDKLVWECPNCGNRDETKMNIARRTCGYIGINGFNQGRMDEIDNRVLHVCQQENK